LVNATDQIMRGVILQTTCACLDFAASCDGMLVFSAQQLRNVSQQ
jgi:hypothetical protein